MAVVAVLMAQADIQEELVRILKEANWIARMGKVPPREHGEVELFIVVVAELEHQHRIVAVGLHGAELVAMVAVALELEIIIHRERMERQILAVEPGGSGYCKSTGTLSSSGGSGIVLVHLY